MNKVSSIYTAGAISIACALLLTLGARNGVHAALQPASQFPTVKSNRVSGIHPAGEFQVSDDGQYIYEIGDQISFAEIERTTPQNSPPVHSLGIWQFPRMIGWSLDNSQVAAMVQSSTCTYPELESQVTIFNVNTGVQSAFCIPFSSGEAQPTSWSPFSNSTLFAQNNWIIDTTTHAITDVKLPDVQPLDFPNYVNTVQWTGLGQVLWDNNTQQPFGIVSYSDHMRAFFVCPLGIGTDPNNPDPDTCNQFYQIADPSPIARVVLLQWKLSTAGHFLLWMAQEIPQSVLSQTPTVDLTQHPLPTDAPGEPYNPLITPTSAPTRTPVAINHSQLDTVLYLTEIPSGVTKELFRLPGLQQGGLYVASDFDWSIDGRTIALRLAQSPHNEGLLLLSLQWP